MISRTVSAAINKVLIGRIAMACASREHAALRLSMADGQHRQQSERLHAYGASITIVLAAAAIASYIPARRAASFEPMEMLRDDH